MGFQHHKTQIFIAKTVKFPKNGSRSQVACQICLDFTFRVTKYPDLADIAKILHSSLPNKPFEALKSLPFRSTPLLALFKPNSHNSGKSLQKSLSYPCARTLNCLKSTSRFDPCAEIIGQISSNTRLFNIVLFCDLFCDFILCNSP